MNERHSILWTLAFSFAFVLATAGMFSNAPRSLPDLADSPEKSVLELRDGAGLPLCADVRSGRCRLLDSVSHRGKPVAGATAAGSTLPLPCHREGTRQVRAMRPPAPMLPLAKLQI